MFRRLRRILLILVASFLGLVLTAFLVGNVILRSSSPRLEGEIELDGLSRPVTVTRDALGVPGAATPLLPGPAEFRLELVPWIMTPDG